MGYLRDKLTESQNIVNHYEYELSEEVTNRKLEWQKQIAERLENDEYEGVLNVEDEELTLEIETYEPCVDEVFKNEITIISVVSIDGEVYVTDEDEDEYFIDDIDEATFKLIYEAVMELTEE